MVPSPSQSAPPNPSPDVPGRIRRPVASPRLQLAQVNVATLRQPIDHPDSAPFADALDDVNALAEASAGYVWRLQDEGGNATEIKAFADPLKIINLTVWESLAALRDFAYRGMHREYLRRRSEWFTSDPGTSATALWWIPAGSVPTVEDARRRLAFIEQFGNSPYAFRVGQRQPQLGIIRTDLSDPVAQALIEALNRELAALYPEPGSNFFALDADQVAPGRGGFFVTYVDGRPLGCGAYRRLDRTTAEIKRMYVDPAARGGKLGAAMVDTIETAAHADGITRLVLETGVRQEAAVRLYQRCGFVSVPCWGEYVHAATSVCFAKDLEPLPAP